jgi:hypothetical protein
MTSKITKTERNHIVMKGIFLLLFITVVFTGSGYSQCTGTATNASSQNWSSTSFASCAAGAATNGGTYSGNIIISGLSGNETLNFDINKFINGSLTFSANGGGVGDEAVFIVKSGKTLQTNGAFTVGDNFKLIVEEGASVIFNGNITAGKNFILENYGTISSTTLEVGNGATINIHESGYLNLNTSNLVAGNDLKLTVDGALKAQNISAGLSANITINSGALVNVAYDLNAGNGAVLNINEAVLFNNVTLGTGADVNVNNATLSTTYTFKAGSGSSIEGNGTMAGQTLDLPSNATCGSSGCPTLNYQYCGSNLPPVMCASMCNVNPGSVSGSASKCSGTNSGTLTLTNYAGTIVRWEYSDSPFSSWTTITNTSTTQTYSNLTRSRKYRVVVRKTSGTCTGNSAPATISISGTAPAVTGGSVCTGGDVILTASGAPAGDTYKWYSASSGGSSFATGSSITVNVSLTKDYWVSSYSSSCESSRVKVTATVNPSPSEPGVTNASRCNGGEITVSASGASASQNYKWYATSEAATPIQTGGADLTSTISTTTTYYVSKYNTTTGCESSRVAVTATINTTVVSPDITIARNIPGTICPGKSVSFTATLASASTGTYQWKIGTTNVGTNSASFTTDQLQNNDQVTCTFTPTAVCYTAKTSNTLTVPVTAQNTWVGTSSSDWTNVNNWCGGVPTITQDIVIPTGTAFAPTISSAAYAKNVTVNSGATLTIASGAVADFRGNVVINGNWVETGSATITIGGNANFSNSNSGNSLESLSALTVEGQLTFPTNGKIVMSGNGVLILGANATYTGNSETKFVEGKMRKIFASTDKFEFPLGSGTISGKMAITPESASPQSSFTISYFRANPKVAVNDEDRTNPSDPDYLFKVSDVEYWVYEGSSGASAKASLFWSANSYVNENGDLSDLKVSTYNSTRGVWQALQTVVDEGNEVQLFAVSTKSISTVDAISESGILTLGSSSTIHTLPVSISDFNLISLNEGVELKWKTSDKSAHITFEVQRSFDGFKTFEILTVIDGHGETDAAAHYSYLDRQGKNSIVYYRIRQKDNDQEDKYSEIKFISFNRTSSSKLYPNPTAGEVVVDIEEITSEPQVQYVIIGSDGLTKVQGTKVSGQDISSELSKDVQNLKVGTYTVFIKTSKTRHSIKLIKI